MLVTRMRTAENGCCASLMTRPKRVPVIVSPRSDGAANARPGETNVAIRTIITRVRRRNRMGDTHLRVRRTEPGSGEGRRDCLRSSRADSIMTITLRSFSKDRVRDLARITRGSAPTVPIPGRPVQIDRPDNSKNQNWYFRATCICLGLSEVLTA